MSTTTQPVSRARRDIQPRAPRRAGPAAAVALAFTTAMAFSTAPTPLYGVYQRAAGWSMTGVTLAFAAYAVGVLVSLVVAGHLSDHRGRRQMLVTGLGVEVVAAALFAASTDLPVVMLARFVGGIGVGLLTGTATAWIGELLRRPRAAMLLAAVANLGGFAVGPLVAALLARSAAEPLRLPYLVLGGALAVAALVASRVPETVPMPQTPRLWQPQRVRVPAQDRPRYVAAAVSTAAAFAVLGLFSSLAPGFVALLVDRPTLLLAGAVAALVFGMSAAAQVLLAALPVRSMTRLGLLTLLLGLVLVTVAVWVAALAPFLVGGAVAGIGGGLLVRAGMVTVTQLARPDERAGAVAGLFVAGYAGLALPVLGMGIALHWASPRAALTGFAAAILAPVVLSARRLLAPDAGRTTTTPTTPTPPPVLHAPGTRGYRRATAAYSRGHALTPARAGTVTTVEQVRQAVRVAAAAGTGVRMQSTGHAAGSMRPMTTESLLRVAIAEPVRVDVVARTVRIPAGTRWGDVVAALAPHGLAVPHGSASEVGAVGYLLRGGLSLYGRHAGVAANSVQAIELVLADGRLLTVDRTHEPELFWALRGGGGGFGVVTAVTVRAFPVAAVVTGTTFWPAVHAAELATRWEEWTRTAPRLASTALRLMSVPPLPGVPLRLIGRSVVCIDGAALAGTPTDLAAAEETVDDLLRPLRAVARPVVDTWRTGGPLDVPYTHMDPPLSLPHSGDHLLLRGLGARGVADVVRGAGAGGTLASVELRQLGGALAEAPADGGAVARMHGEHAYLAIGVHSPRRPASAVAATLAEARRVVEPWSTGYTAPTFVTGAGAPQRSFDVDVAARVGAVRSAVDPAGMFAGDVAAGAVPGVQGARSPAVDDRAGATSVR